MNERSGLNISSCTGEICADSTTIRIPSLKLLTPNSEIDLTAQTYWKLIDIPTTGHLSTRLNARIGKQDVLLFAGNLPDTFKDNYPIHPLIIRAGTEGNLTQMQISRFHIDLPGAFALDGGGEFWNINDSIRRNGNMNLQMQTGDLNFLTGLAGHIRRPRQHEAGCTNRLERGTYYRRPQAARTNRFHGIECFLQSF